MLVVKVSFFAGGFFLNMTPEWGVSLWERIFLEEFEATSNIDRPSRGTVPWRPGIYNPNKLYQGEVSVRR